MSASQSMHTIAELEKLPGNRESLIRLTQAISSGAAFTPILGSGISAATGYPTWSDFLRDSASKSAFPAQIANLVNTGNYEESAEMLLDPRSKIALHNTIAETYGAYTLVCNDFPRYLSLLPLLFDRTVLSLNLDRAIETIYFKAGSPFQRVVWDIHAQSVLDMYDVDETITDRLLIKLNGDVSIRSQRVLTVGDYDRVYWVIAADTQSQTDITSGSLHLPTGSYKTPMTKLIRQVVSKNPFIFIGCSLLPGRMLTILQQFIADPANENFAIIERPANEHSLYELEKTLMRFNITPIWYPANCHDYVGVILEELYKYLPQEKLAARTPKLFRTFHGPNPDFYGREEQIREIRTSLVTKGACHITQAVMNMDGIGKSQLANEYAFRYSKEYDLVWWLDASSEEAICNGFINMAIALLLPVINNPDRHSIVEAALVWLETHNNWLLIYDDALSITTTGELLPEAGANKSAQKRHIIVITKDPSWSGFGNQVNIPNWTREEATNYLLAKTGEYNRAMGDLVAATLGDLPLAVNQAAAYIEATGKNLTAFIDIFRVLQSRMFGQPQLPHEYWATISTTSRLAYEHIVKPQITIDRSKMKGRQMASALINVMAFLRWHNIYLEMLNKFPSADGKAALLGAISSLARFGLIDWADDHVNMHLTVQQAAIERIGDKERIGIIAQAVDMVEAVYPNDCEKPTSWPNCERYLLHGHTLLIYVERYHQAKDGSCFLANHVGLYLRNRNCLEEAQGYLERAMRMAEQSYTPDHVHVGITANNLGSVLHDLNDLKGAKKVYERALAIFERQLGKNHENTNVVRENLNRVLSKIAQHGQ